MNLSEYEVVKYLILNRSKIDIGYGANTNINIYQAGDIFDFNVEVICLYTDLDKLIKRANLTKKQQMTLTLLYDGNSIPDVAKILKSKRNSVFEMLDRIIEKIVNENNELWYYTMGKNGMILT